MKKNIKTKKLIPIYLSLFMALNITTLANAKIKYTPKPTIKTNNNTLNKTYTKNPINSKKFSENLKSLLSNLKNKSSFLNNNNLNSNLNSNLNNLNSNLNNLNSNLNNPLLSISPNRYNKKYGKDYNQRINLKFSSGDKLLNGVALWFINNNIMEEIYKKLNISKRPNEEKSSFFGYMTGSKDPELHIILPDDKSEAFDEANNNLENYLKNNFKQLCESFATNKMTATSTANMLKNIDQEITREISNIKSEIKKINGSSTYSNKDFYILKGQQFFDSEDFKCFVNFLNPNLYNFLKQNLNTEKNEKNKNNIFYMIGKEICKNTLQDLKQKLSKMNSLKSSFSRFMPKKETSSIFNFLNDDYYFKNNKRNIFDFDDDDDDDDDSFNIFGRKNSRTRKVKEYENKINEITKRLSNTIRNSITFKELKKENIATLDENKKEYEKYIKRLNLILENMNLNKKQKDDSENYLNNDIEHVVGSLKHDYKKIKKMLKENKNKGGRSEELKGEMDKTLDSLHLSKTFKKNKKQNDKELTKKAKEWLPIKVKYIKNLLNNKKLKNIKGKFTENQNSDKTNLSNSTTDISEQSTMDGTNLNNLSKDILSQTNFNEANLNNKNLNLSKLQNTKKLKNNDLKKQQKLNNKSLDIKNLQAMKNLINNISKKTNKKTSKKSN